jgi:hypothetical protein
VRISENSLHCEKFPAFIRVKGNSLLVQELHHPHSHFLMAWSRIYQPRGTFRNIKMEWIVTP